MQTFGQGLEGLGSLLQDHSNRLSMDKESLVKQGYTNNALFPDSLPGQSTQEQQTIQQLLAAIDNGVPLSVAVPASNILTNAYRNQLRDRLSVACHDVCTAPPKARATAIFRA